MSSCGMYIPLSDDKHRKVRDSSKKRTGNPRQNAVWEFFSNGQKIFFFQLNFVLDCICLGLNFVSDYIRQLYFVCNHLIFPVFLQIVKK